ncbi:MAG: UDP-N-acetylmuramate--L-alanine ligase [Phycisphaerales bacterium]|nr:UDP-N-acetylmuramate--L-alanine ligase [Phycisphaerales bacterium]
MLHVQNRNKDFSLKLLMERKGQSIYFLGIGGIGMSALAQYFLAQGFVVYGYDRTPSLLTYELEDLGMHIHYHEDVQGIPKDVALVVFTPAIPQDHEELLFYINNRYPVLKRSEVLQLITDHSFNICIAGTHGKTTTTTLVAHILRDTEYGCNAFLGGISCNYNTNFWSNARNVTVIEGDEYDRSFLNLSPNNALITSMDPDHLDIYKTATLMEDAYLDFCGKIKQGGYLVYKYGLARTADLQKIPHARTYHVSDIRADFYARNIQLVDQQYQFDIVTPTHIVAGLHLQLGGLHNVENTVAAVALLSTIDIDVHKMKKAIASFLGVKRRFEYIIKSKNQILIDDYAHHPSELDALISGAKNIFPDKPLTLVFQPHLYSRTKDLAKEFARSLDQADEVILLPIYPARELPLPNISSETIAEKMVLKNKRILDKDAFKSWVRDEARSLLIMAGAGDIDLLVYEVKEILLNRKKHL